MKEPMHDMIPRHTGMSESEGSLKKSMVQKKRQAIKKVIKRRKVYNY